MTWIERIGLLRAAERAELPADGAPRDWRIWDLTEATARPSLVIPSSVRTVRPRRTVYAPTTTPGRRTDLHVPDGPR